MWTNKKTTMSKSVQMLLIFSLTYIACRSDEIPKLTSSDALKPFKIDELGEKLKDLLEKGPELPELPEIELEFKDLFKKLKFLSLRMPEDFVFDVNKYGPRASHPLLQNAKAMECLKSNDQMTRFLRRVKEALKDLLDDSREVLDDKKQNDTSDEVDIAKKDSQEMDDHRVTKRDTKVGDLDFDDLFDSFETDDFECLSAFVNDREKRFLCSHFTQGSSSIFSRINEGGFQCLGSLDDDVSHEILDDLLDEAKLEGKSSHEENPLDDLHDSADVDDLFDDVLGDVESIEEPDDLLQQINDLIDDALDSNEDLDDVLENLKSDTKDDEGEIKSEEVPNDFRRIVIGNMDDDRVKFLEIRERVVLNGARVAIGDDVDETRDNDEKRNRDDDDDDDDDDKKGRWRSDLSESHQLTIFHQIMLKPTNSWNSSDIQNLLRLAPDAIDDDFLESLPENLVNAHLQQFARVAMRHNSNPGLRYALRARLDTQLSTLDSTRLRQLGPALLTLRYDQIQQLDGKVFLDVDIDDIFDKDDSKEKDDEDDSKEVHKDEKKPKPKRKDDNDDDDDDDDDEKEIARFAIGQRIKASLNSTTVNGVHLARAMRYLHDDLDFVRGLNPDDLFESLKDISDLDYDDDDARFVFAHMAMSSRFPQASRMTGANLTAMGHLVRGLGVYHMTELHKEAVKEALDKIKDIDFDDDQAEILFHDIVDDDEVEKLELVNFRRFGKLVKGMPTGQLMRIKSDVLDDLLDDLDDIDLSDAQKRIVAGMALQNKMTHQKFLKLDSFTEVISVSDLDDLDDDDVYVYMNVTSKLDWSVSQAAVLAHTYKNRVGASMFKTSHVGTLGKVALGLYPDDLDDLMKTDDDFLDLADKLKDIDDDLTSGQIDELVESFSELTELDTKGFEIDELKAVRSAHILAYLSKEKFEKLTFNPAGRKAFINQMAKLETHKMSRDHMHFLATKILKLLDEDDSKEVKDDSDSKRLRLLGQLTLGLSPDQLKEFSAIAFLDNLDIFRTLPLSALQAKVVLDKMKDITEEWHCRPDIMARLGPLLLHDDNPLSDDCDFDSKKGLLGSFKMVMKGLEKRREIIKERLEEGFQREDDLIDLDDIGEKRLTAAMVLLATQTTKPIARRRRAVQAPITCDILMMLRGSARQVDHQTLTSMKDEDFINCLSTIGSISDWPSESLSALVNKAKMVLNDTKQWTNEQIRRFGSLTSGLTVEEINQLQLKGVDAMYSVGKHGKLSAEQLRAGFQRWMNLTGKQDVKQISDGEFSALSEFVCALDVTDIEKISATSFKRSIEVIGRTVSCTGPQHTAYVQKATSVFGTDVSKWQPALIGDMGILLAGFSPEQIKTINNKQLSLIQPKVVSRLPKERIAAMTNEQIKSLSTNQANALTRVQYDALTAEQQKLVDAKASLAFTGSPTTTHHPKDHGKNGVTMVSYSAVIIISTMLASFL